MRWIDRVILLFVGAGVWALALSYVLEEQHAAAQSLSVDDVVYEALSAVARSCSVHGDVYIYSAEYGEIDGGYLSC